MLDLSEACRNRQASLNFDPSSPSRHPPTTTPLPRRLRVDGWDCDGGRNPWAQFLCHNFQQGCPFFPCSTQSLVRFPNKCLWPQGAVTSTSPCLHEASQLPQGTGTLRPQPPTPPGSHDSYSALRGRRTEQWQCAVEQGPCS